jgi:hypothetical protein
VTIRHGVIIGRYVVWTYLFMLQTLFIWVSRDYKTRCYLWELRRLNLFIYTSGAVYISQSWLWDSLLSLGPSSTSDLICLCDVPLILYVRYTVIVRIFRTQTFHRVCNQHQTIQCAYYCTCRVCCLFLELTNILSMNDMLLHLFKSRQIYFVIISHWYNKTSRHVSSWKIWGLVTSSSLLQTSTQFLHAVFSTWMNSVCREMYVRRWGNSYCVVLL